ncbi:hypothetical protein L6452_21899 [Arctium lappa]|uniref:Uncharacterized protein n=1 Tax=Arctium lappa TaxID=4217 RepID=A0ACB9AXG0_ARCLA|nr:hypothetical protein L6452_21899 [Arctium lappa]
MGGGRQEVEGGEPRVVKGGERQEVVKGGGPQVVVGGERREVVVGDALVVVCGGGLMVGLVWSFSLCYLILVLVVEGRERDGVWIYNGDA